MAATLMVTAATTGADPDPDGFAVVLDGHAGRPLGRNATLTLVDLEPGDHLVGLDGSAPNCAITGENPRRVSLEAGASVRLTFYVNCTSATGALAVHTNTLGDGQDPDGYTVAVDGGKGRRIAPNGSVTISALAPGDHQIDVSDVITNCSLSGGPARTVSVQAGVTVDLSLSIDCVARSLHITVTTTGHAPDPNGYTVTVDGGSSQAVGVAGSVEIGGLIDGVHTVTLGDLAPFCDPGQNPRTIQVAGGDMTVPFEISCAGPPTDGRILFNASAGAEVHVFAMSADGSGVVDLTPHASAYAARWSADRSKIVFETYRNGDNEVFVMDADGSHQTRLAAGRSPTWSPDGTRIALISAQRLAVMNADGSNLHRFATGSQSDSPSWSPDGSAIAYTELNLGRCIVVHFDPVCARDIHVLNADGTGGRQVTHATDPHAEASSPAWSPDGSTIAFWRSTSGSTGDLYLISPDGSQSLQLTFSTQVTEAFPVWSPDGLALAFGMRSGSAGDADYDIALIARQGGPTFNLFTGPGEQVPTSWQ
ncbi:MAG: TolB family protein [Gemmatimonadales bacterium]